MRLSMRFALIKREKNAKNREKSDFFAYCEL
jgi:hypothetical protein